jgi:hypothetical protein
VFMAAALDYGDTIAGVHTRYKRPIAARLARSARAVAYNESGVYYTGPVADVATLATDGKSVTLKFKSVGAGGLNLRWPGGFSVCAVKQADQCFKWSNNANFYNVTAAMGSSLDELLLSLPPAAAAKVAALGGVGIVRYEWNALPCRWPALESCAVYSREEVMLPAPPFMIGVGENSSQQPPPCIGDAAFSESRHDVLSTARAALSPLPESGDADTPESGDADMPASPPPPAFNRFNSALEDAPASTPRRFVHPGVFVGAEQLAFMRAQVQLDGTVFNASLETLSKWTYMNGRNSSSMSAGWNGTVSCGFYDSHDYGCKNETSDSTTVWVQAMLWATTGDIKWATRAIAILNFYGKNLKAYGDFGNGKLEAAWAADKWARSAELLSSTGAPWASTDVAAFKRVLATVSVPMLYNGSCYNGNWELAMIEGLASIAVFTENTTLWDHAIQMWQARLPAYFYMATDGPKPVNVPSCATSNWHGQTVFNVSVNGVSQETCRDFAHTSYGTHTVLRLYSHCMLIL